MRYSCNPNDIIKEIVNVLKTKYTGLDNSDIMVLGLVSGNINS